MNNMSISFNNVSSSDRASKVYIELAGVKKSLADLFIPACGMIFGMYDPDKTTVTDYEPVKVTDADDVGEKAGFGSHAHRQALKFPAAVFLQGNGVYWMPIPDPSGTAATETITFSGAATSAGTYYFGIGGDLIQVSVSIGDTAAEIAAALVTAISAEQDLPVEATAADAVVTLTAKFTSTQGNQILVVVNPAGDTQEDYNPSGVTVTLENSDGYLAGGATDPDLEDCFFDSSGNDILGDRWYTAMTMPFVDSTNIAYYEQSAALRADPAVNRFFGSYAGYVDKTYAEALAIPATINSKYIGTIWENRYRCPDFELAAELVGNILDSQNENPARPYKTLELNGDFDSDTTNRRFDQNNALFKAGMSYCNIVGTALQLGDIALTYRTNSSGGAATDWYDAVSLHRRQAKAYSIEQLFKTDTYARSVVVDDDAVTAVDWAIAPKDIIAALTKLVTDLWVPYGWTKNADDVIDSIAAEINSAYESRIDASITDDEAQALRQIAIKYAFYY